MLGENILIFALDPKLNPNDTDVFFDACVPGGGPIGPPPGKSIFTLEKGNFSS